MAINVPSHHKAALMAIARLNDQSLEEFYAALKQVPGNVEDRKELAKQVSGYVKSLKSEDVEKILNVLTSLYQVRGRLGTTPKKLATEVREALQKEEALPEGDGQKLRDRLEKLLSSDSLNIWPLKAKELQMDVERYFCDARILTDLRPVFGSEIDSPKGMIVIHTLKLAYHDSMTNRHEEIFIAVDNNDLQKLKAILERAERKAKSLLSRLESAGIKTIDPS